MFGFFKKTTVAVTFVDDETGKDFAVTEAPLTQLPDTFVIETKLEIHGQDYLVVRADPVTKAEFSKSKRLTLRLRRMDAQMIDPKNLLFSLPSICGTMYPQSRLATAGEVPHQLHEDDWRQCEYVSVLHTPLVAAELADIRRIHNEFSVEPGWSEVHMRKRIPAPLLPGLRWSEIVARLTRFEPVGGVSLEPGTIVKGSVGVALAHGVLLWGVEGDAGLQALCVEHRHQASAETVAALERLSDELDLVLVDWCRCEAHPPAGASLEGASGLAWDA